MNNYRLYDTTIRKWTASLSPWHAVLYALCVCQRSISLYFEFVANEKWGDKEAFKISHKLLEGYLSGIVPSAVELAECKARIEKFTPDTEEFPEGVYACDTGIIHLYSLSLIEEFNAEHAYYIARYCYELVDCAAGARIQPKGGHMTPDIEEQIGSHALVQAELMWQSKGQQMISEIPKFDVVKAKQFICFWTAEPIIRMI